MNIEASQFLNETVCFPFIACSSTNNGVEQDLRAIRQSTDFSSQALCKMEILMGTSLCSILVDLMMFP